MEVGSRVGGRVLEVHVREGDNVVAGQPLVTLEKGDLPAQRLIAQGQLEQAQGVLQKVASRTLPTARRAELAEAEARLQVQQALEAKAKLDDERAQKLFSSGAGTRVDADNAALALRTASAQVAAQRAQKESLLHGTPEDVRSGEGMVDGRAGAPATDRRDARRARRPGPARGARRVARPAPRRHPRPQRAGRHAARAGELFVRIYVPETQIGRIRPGLEVPIFVDSFPGRAFHGRVESVASEGEFSPRNLQTADERADQVFATRVGIEDGADVLRAGMAAFVRVPR